MMELRKRIRGALIFAAVLGATSALVGCGEESTEVPPTESVEPTTAVTTLVTTTGDQFPPIDSSFANVPNDIPGGAAGADLQTAAQFAWKEFIALNWPADTSTRDKPDNSRRFGDTQGGPTVWQTFRSKVEIFTYAKDRTAAAPPGFNTNPADSYGYFILPTDADGYIYSGESYSSCTTGSDDVPALPWVNLDEITEIELNDMFAGTVGGEKVDQLIRFAVKANKTQYVYVAENDLYDPNSANSNSKFTTWFDAIAPNSGPQTVPNPADVIRFPGPAAGEPGTIEVKSAWRKLNQSEERDDFHVRTVRYYKNNGGTPCYLDEEWAMIALHIMSRVASTPDYFTFATFEHSDNILNADGTPVEDGDGRVIAASAGPATEPSLSYMDNPGKVTASGSFCAEPGNRLYYINNPSQIDIPTGSTKKDENGFAIDSNICINYRDFPIPQQVIEVNSAAHAAIQTYVGGPSVWDNYKLVNVQYKPFDKANRNPDNMPTFYLSNIVVETNYTLQNFRGQLTKGGAPTDEQLGSFPPQPPNVLTFNQKVNPFNMGGCMGCHGVAQAGGADFSFILNRKIPAFEPEFPHNSAESKALSPAESKAISEFLSGRAQK